MLIFKNNTTTILSKNYFLNARFSTWFTNDARGHKKKIKWVSKIRDAHFTSGGADLTVVSSGLYYYHIMMWLSKFGKEKFIFVDGDLLLLWFF